MRILITGAGGQVGRALATELAGCGEVVAADRSAFDLARPEALAGRLETLRPDLILNAAAYTAVDQAEAEPDLAMKINAEAVGALGVWAASRRVPVIHFSTDYVFDGVKDASYGEADPVNPLSVYGRSKAAGEALLLESGAPALIIRTSWVYSALGRNFLNTILRLAREREVLQIVADQIGAPTSARQIARFVSKLLENSGGRSAEYLRERPPLVHFAAAGRTSWWGLASAIVEGLRARGVRLRVERIIPIPTAHWPTAARRPANSRLCLQRARDVFGVTPHHWRTALDDELDRLSFEAAAREASLEITL